MSQRSSNFSLCRRIPLYLFVSVFLLFCGAARCYAQPLAVTETSTSACAVPSTLTAVATGGTGVYSYSVDGAPYMASNSIPGLALGGHLLSVFDGVSTVSIPVIIGCMQDPNIDVTSTTCGLPNGQLVVHSVGGTGPFLFSIDNGGTFQANDTFPNIYANVYQIVVMDANNTVVTTSKIVFGIAPATLNAVVTPASCVNNDGIVTADASGLPVLTYAIDGGAYGSSPTFTGLVSGLHLLSVTDGNGCITNYKATVPLANTLVLTTSPGPTICESKSAVISVSGSLPNTTYSWTPATGLSSTTVASPVASPTVTTTYYVTASSGACTQPGSVTVTVNPAPLADAGLPITTCYGKSVQLQGSGAPGFKWRPLTFLDNATLADPTVVQPTATTVYHLVVTDNNGCSSLNDASVTVTVTPPPQLFAGNDTNVVAGQPVPLHAVDVSNSGFTQWLWTPADGLNDATLQSPVLGAATQSVTYIVTGTTDAGCMGVDTMTVKVFVEADLYVPNAFSPNHDGHNDVLRVIAPSIRELKAFSVYDRWGAQVFTTANAAVGWDGTRNGKVAAPGVYVWMAVGVDYQGRTVERRGTVMLVR